MLNWIWLSMMCLSVIVGIIEGRIDNVVLAVTNSAKLGFEIALGLSGIMALWLGIMEIVLQSGLIRYFAKSLAFIMKYLFPEIPPEDPAMGEMVMNIAANMLGLGNAATPFGLQAMKALDELNQKKQVASDAMCTFLAINTSSVQLIPTTAIAFLAANGASHPSQIIVTSLLATTISTLVAIIAVKTLAKSRWYRLSEPR